MLPVRTGQLVLTCCAMSSGDLCEMFGCQGAPQNLADTPAKKRGPVARKDSRAQCLRIHPLKEAQKRWRCSKRFQNTTGSRCIPMLLGCVWRECLETGMRGEYGQPRPNEAVARVSSNAQLQTATLWASDFVWQLRTTACRGSTRSVETAW